MQTRVIGRNFSVTSALQQHTESRIAGALKRFANVITAVTVRLVDVNGPRGGADDKHCCITIAMTGGRSLYVEDRDGDLYTAISRAAERARHSVSRMFERHAAH